MVPRASQRAIENSFQKSSCRVTGNPEVILPTAFSLLVYTELPLPTWLFLQKSRTSLNLTVQSRSENALVV
jgi:hypothetical protein